MKIKLFAYWLGGWFTYWAIGTAAVGAIGSIVSSNNKKKAAEAAANAAPYSNVNLQQQQEQALAGNRANQSNIEALLSRADSFSADQALSLEDKVMPGYSKLRSKLAETSSSLLNNPYELPKDVQDNLGRIAAERGISAGTRGQFNDFSLLRDFGINSLQYGQQRIAQSQGISALLSSISPKVNPMSPLSFYITPQQNAATTTVNNMQNQAIAQAGANNRAQVSSQASTDLWANLTKLAGVAGGAFGGSDNSNTDYVTPNNYPIGSSGSIGGVSPAGAH